MASPTPGGRPSPRATLFLAAVMGVTGCGSDGSTAPPPSPPGNAPGVLIVSMRTVGDQLDSDGYTVVLDQTPGVDVQINGELRITGLTPGAHSLEVRDIASNCRLTNVENPGSVFVLAGVTVRVDLEVFCLQPDPGRIFYSTVGGSVRVMNALGGDRRVLPNLRADKVEVSPDQKQICFGRDDDIWVADVDGSNAVNRTNTPDRGEGRPSWSPDGRQIAYERQEVIGSSDNHLFVMNADGSGVTSLAPPEWTGGEPAWSPDGTRIAFRSHNDSSPGGDLWTIAPDGSQLTQLTVRGSLDTNPAWSPDGERLVFTRFTGPPAEGGTDFELFVINADGTGLRQLTNDDRRTSEADWSPDGRWIVFASADLGGEGFDLFVMRADGTDRLRLTFGERAGLPNWVP